MSGHSKWSNIKNRKGAVDKKRSEVFTRASKNIMTALRSGGGIALKTAIDQAKEVNMPRENIERLQNRYVERKAHLVYCRFEGYGPHNVPLVIEVETDNKNRTLGEIKLLFRDIGGSLGSEGSVGYLFDRLGEIEISQNMNDTQQLELIDFGLVEYSDSIVTCEVENLSIMDKKIKELGFEVVRSEIVMKCKQLVKLNSEDEIGEVMDLIDALEEHDDVVNVFSGFTLNV
ncbi:MAG: YebC/PmpR family DNA-binding transcriptional regulator [Candidatus Shapirobacteria bacterium]